MTRSEHRAPLLFNHSAQKLTLFDSQKSHILIIRIIFLLSILPISTKNKMDKLLSMKDVLPGKKKTLNRSCHDFKRPISSFSFFYSLSIKKHIARTLYNLN